MDTPRPTELAKAGFYFAPTADSPDGCAHFCNDKFFSAWDPADDPWTVLAENCPDCPFVLGKSNNVPLPSAYKPSGGSAASASAPTGPNKNLGSYLAGCDEGNSGKGQQQSNAEAKNLGNYLSGALERAGGSSSAQGGAAEAQSNAAAAASDPPSSEEKPAKPGVGDFDFGAAVGGLGRFFTGGGGGGGDD